MFDQESAPKSQHPANDLDEQPPIKDDEVQSVDAKGNAKPKQAPKEVTARVVALRPGPKREPTKDEIDKGMGARETTILVFSMGTIHGLQPFMIAILANAQRDVVTIDRATQDTAEASVETSLDYTREALKATSNNLTFKHR